MKILLINYNYLYYLTIHQVIICKQILFKTNLITEFFLGFNLITNYNFHDRTKEHKHIKRINEEPDHLHA